MESFWKCAPVNGAIRPLFPVFDLDVRKEKSTLVFSNLNRLLLLGKDGDRKEE